MTEQKRPRLVDFRAVKAAVSIEQVLQHYGLTDQLKRNGDSLSGSCPIHHGTNPTQFRVSLSKNCWHCFGDCQGGGNILDLVSRLENCSIREAALKLAEWFGVVCQAPQRAPPSRQPEPAKAVPVQEQAPQAKTDSPEAASVPQEGTGTVETSAQTAEESEANKPLGFTLKNLDQAHPYLQERGLAPETIAEFGIGLCNAGTMIGRIVIPIHNVNGQLVGYIGRWPGNPPPDVPKYKLPKGFWKSAEVFNLQRAIKESADEPLLIVEGVFDVLKLWQHGFRRVVALMGSSLSPAQEELLRRSTCASSRIILMLDEDEAGRAARDEIALRISRWGFVKVHRFRTQGAQPEHLPREELVAIVG